MWTLIGTLRDGTSIRGYVEKGLIEVHSIEQQYQELLEESFKRKYNFKRRMSVGDKLVIRHYLETHPVEEWGSIDEHESHQELVNRSYNDKCKYSPIRDYMKSIEQDVREMRRFKNWFGG
jgi:hypothetical protein